MNILTGLDDIKARIHVRLRSELDCHPPTPESPKTGLIYPLSDILVDELGNADETPPVKTFWNPAYGLPQSPATGDRYIALVDGNGWTKDNIYAWTGAEWSVIPYRVGRIVYVINQHTWYGALDDGWQPLLSHNNGGGGTGALEPDKAVVTDSTGAIVTLRNVTATEVSYLCGARTFLQSQIDDLAVDLESEIDIRASADANIRQYIYESVASLQDWISAKQDKLTPGDNVTIVGNVISSNDTGLWAALATERGARDSKDSELLRLLGDEGSQRAAADSELSARIDALDVGGDGGGGEADSTNHLVYLGHLHIAEPTASELTAFAESQAAELFGDAELKTGYTVRDELDRDWRWVDDGGPPPNWYLVTFSAVGGGRLVARVDGHEINSGELVLEGKNIIFLAAPDDGFEVVKWVHNGNGINDGSLVYIVPVSSDKDVVAHFAAIPPPQDNRMHDPKDGRYYGVLSSGGLYWTTENYAYAGAGVYYNNAGSEPFSGAGRLYTYAEAAANAPPGWRLPTTEELTALADAAGTGTNLTKNGGGSGDWQASGSITHNDTLGFGLLPAGSANDASTFNYLSQRAYLWVDNAGIASGSMRARTVMYSSANLSSLTDRTSSHKLSVRYVKEVS
jgi:uncharacterized protein (TIGR02145 family)